MRLADRPQAHGFRLDVHARLGSTNDEAMRRARAGDAGRLWVLAYEQTKGRGRHARQWVSPRGNLYASLLLVDPAPASLAPQLGFVAGVALATTVSKLVRHDRRLELKWPNDLLYAGAKLAGILLEGAQMTSGFACVIGVGVNCRSHPTALVYPATDLGAFSLTSDPAAVFEALSDEMVAWLDIWDHGRGFARIRDAWLAFAGGVGEIVTISGAGGTRAGRFRGLDTEGRLLLEHDGETMVVEAGDVFLPAFPERVNTQDLCQ